jgi:hypothetical protein
VTFTATVTAGNVGVSSGSVQFSEQTADGGSTPLGTTPLDSSGNASVIHTFATTGEHLIKADYTDTTDYYQASSATQTQHVDPAKPRTPIGFVQAAPGNSETANNDNVSTAPFGASIAVGNLIVVWVFWSSTPARALTTVTDTVGNGYQRAIGPTGGIGDLSAFQQEIWIAKNIKPGANVSVKAIFGAIFNDEKNIAAFEYSGADQVAPVDKTAAATGAGADASVGTPVTTAPGIVFAAAVFKNTGTSGPGFTSRSTLQGNAAEDESRSAPGPVSATFVNDAQNWIAHLVAIK